MSLTSLLKIKDMKEAFKQQFPKPKFAEKMELLAPAVTKNYITVGIAFDYLLRFHLKYVNPQAVEKKWIAELATSFLVPKSQRGTIDDEIFEDVYRRAVNMVRQAKDNYGHYLTHGSLNDDLARSALELAHLDPLFRGGTNAEMAVITWLQSGHIDEADIGDLNNLITCVDEM